MKKIINIAGLALVALIAMFNINNMIPNAITSDKIETSQDFIVEGNVSKNILEAYQRDFDNLDPEMKKHISSVTITTEDLGKKFDMKLDANILAITYGTDIYINGNRYKEIVMIHESFHAYDYDNNWITESDDFQKIYKAEKDSIQVSPGNTQNVYEFWASAGEKFYTDPELLESLAPQTYNFMNNHIKLIR